MPVAKPDFGGKLIASRKMALSGRVRALVSKSGLHFFDSGSHRPMLVNRDGSGTGARRRGPRAPVR